MWVSSTLSWVFRRKGPRQSRRKKAEKQKTRVARKRSGRMAGIGFDGGRRLRGLASIREWVSMCLGGESRARQGHDLLCTHQVIRERGEGRQQTEVLTVCSGSGGGGGGGGAKRGA